MGPFPEENITPEIDFCGAIEQVFLFESSTIVTYFGVPART
jgi:hypothetical protein